MTPQHPAAPETETDANGWVTDDDRDCLRVAFGIEFREPVDHVRFAQGIAAVERIVAERVRVVEGERDAARAQIRDREANGAEKRAESAEAAHERLRAEALAVLPADCWVFSRSSPDTHLVSCVELIGGTFGNGAVWTQVMCCLPCRLRSLLGGGEAR